MVAFRDSSGVVTGINASSIVVPVPAAVVAGDLMIALINLGNIGPGVDTTGWAHIAGSPHFEDQFLDNHFVVQTRIADAGDEAGGNYTWDRQVSNFTPIGGVIIAYSDAALALDFSTITGHRVGHSNGDPEYSDTDVAAEIHLTAIAITGELFLGGFSIISPSAGFTEREDVNFNGNGGHIQVQDRASPGVGPFTVNLALTAGAPISTHSFVTIGIGAAFVAPTDTTELDEVEVLAEDTLLLTFSASMSNNAALKATSSYVITPDDGGAAVEVTKVLSGDDSFTDILALVITKPTLGKTYTVTVNNALISSDTKTVNPIADSKQFQGRTTKMDKAVRIMPEIFDRRPTAVIRSVYQAIMREDDAIGGNRDDFLD